MKKYLVRLNSKDKYYIVDKQEIYPFINDRDQIPTQQRKFKTFFNAAFSSRISIVLMNKKQIKEMTMEVNNMKRHQDNIDNFIHLITKTI